MTADNNGRNLTTRWTGAAGACFVTRLVRRRLHEVAPPVQLWVIRLGRHMLIRAEEQRDWVATRTVNVSAFGIEWHDGENYDGGAEIRSLILQRDRVFIKLDRDLELGVAFRVPDKKFATLKSFLSRMIDARVYIAE